MYVQTSRLEGTTRDLVGLAVLAPGDMLASGSEAGMSRRGVRAFAWC